MNVIVLESVARAMFGHQRPPTLAMEQAGEAPCDRCVDQLVRWLVVPEPLVCETCNGDGLALGTHNVVCGDCCDCDGTGRPQTVNIVSIVPWAIRQYHGTIGLGDPIPVYRNTHEPERFPYIVANLFGQGWLLRRLGLLDADTDITDAVGDQRIEPGYVAYPITP